MESVMDQKQQVPARKIARLFRQLLLHQPQRFLHYISSHTIHAHGSDEFLPYTGPAKNEIDSEAAENMIAAIDGIAEVLDKYGVKGTWEFLPATVEGLQAYQGKDHIFGQLLANGHEIGVHTHKLEDIAPAVEALQSMGISPITTSGFLAQVSKVGAGDVQAAMSLAIQIPVERPDRRHSQPISWGRYEYYQFSLPKCTWCGQ